MPYKYIGRTHDFKGKTLWEIIGNLKNLGIGRIVMRHKDTKYPEPTFMKILKVETLPEPEEASPDNVRKVRVLVEKIFRGKLYPKPILIESASYKPDFRLIPKEEEPKYSKTAFASAPDRTLPRTMEMPPLLKELMLQDARIKGEAVKKEDLELIIAYNSKTSKDTYKIANEGEQPTVKISVGLGEPVALRLYRGINAS